MIVIVSGIGILVSIYNSMSERRHEIAVMRALGAGRRTVMFIVLLESILLSLAGGLAGWLVGHALIAALSPWIAAQTGVSDRLLAVCRLRVGYNTRADRVGRRWWAICRPWPPTAPTWPKRSAQPPSRCLRVAPDTSGSPNQLRQYLAARQSMHAIMNPSRISACIDLAWPLARPAGCSLPWPGVAVRPARSGLPVLQRRVADLQRRDRQLAGGRDRQAGAAAAQAGGRRAERFARRGQGEVRNRQDPQGRRRAGQEPRRSKRFTSATARSARRF